MQAVDEEFVLRIGCVLTRSASSSITMFDNQYQQLLCELIIIEL
jgi:hypothetical protein